MVMFRRAGPREGGDTRELSCMSRTPHPADRQSRRIRGGSMAESIKIEFQPVAPVKGGDLVIFVGDDLKPAPSVGKLLGAKSLELVSRVAPLERFKGKAQSAITVPAPPGLEADRLVIVGIG